MADSTTTPSPVSPADTGKILGEKHDKPKGFDPTGMSYGSYEEFAHAWKNTPAYLKLLPDKKINSFDSIKSRWEEAEALREQQAGQPQGGGQDLFGRLNQAAGNLPFPENKAAQLMIPPSNSQAGIDAALFAAAGPLGKAIDPILENAGPIARFGMRMAVPTAAGAMGGAIQGGKEGAITGAASGAGQQLAGEIGSTVFGIARKAMNRADVQAVTDWLENNLTNYPKTQKVFNGVRDIVSQLVGGETDKKLATKLATTESKFPKNLTVPIQFNAQALPTNMQALAGHTADVPIKDALAHLSDLEDIGWDTQFRYKDGKTAQAARSAVHQAEEDIYNAIAVKRPAQAAEWYTNRHRYRLSRTMSNLFREDGVLKGGKIDMMKLQQFLNDAGPKGYKMDLEQAAGEAGARQLKQLWEAAGRGAPPGSMDIPGERPNIRMGVHHLGLPTFYAHPGSLAKHVGYIPFDLGRGRAFAALQILGAHEFTNRLKSIFGNSAGAGNQ
jgi:hypothetical protein